jgi:hypothetical protein
LITYKLLSQASTVESVLKTPVMRPESTGLFPDAIETLAELGCPFAIALQGEWIIKSSTTISNQYGNGIGRGKRLYSTDVKMLVPTEVEHDFTFSYHADFLVDFAAKEATLTTSTYRFRGEPYMFTEHHEYKPTIHDYMYACGCSSPALERWINADEAILPKVRQSWFVHFAPSRFNGKRK